MSSETIPNCNDEHQEPNPGENVNQLAVTVTEVESKTTTPTSVTNDEFNNSSRDRNRDSDEIQIDYDSKNCDPVELTDIDESIVVTDSSVFSDFEQVDETDRSINITSTDDQISSTKSILSNGNLTTGSLSSITTTSQKRGSKKSVTFEPDDEVIKKFVDGEVIIDKKNPFKNGVLQNDPNDRKLAVRIRKGGNSSGDRRRVTLNESDFVSTEDVLRESKFVKTYIKNPDKYFTYDPTIIARLKLEELRELPNVKPKRKVTLSTQTQERLKEIKSKGLQQNFRGLKRSSKQPPQPEVIETKIPTYKKVSKSNYPDLSDIKVKTGTDLDQSLFNPEEVAINAKKFDDRVKKLHISSDDDLDEFDQDLTKSDSSDELKVETVQHTKLPKPAGNQKKPTVQPLGQDDKKSFTNTVNSKEFQEFLTKKGLSLTPKKTEKKLANGNALKIQENHKGIDKSDKNETKERSSVEMDSSTKKVKKPSVFLRLLPSSIFSSKRKTTPKEVVPTPQSLYSNSSDDFKNSSSIKRVVLERQSFHGGSANNTISSNDLRKQMEGSRKSYAGDDRSSSISSALTNAEDCVDDAANDSVIRLSNLHADQRRQPQSATKQQQQSTNESNVPKLVRSRISGRLSAPLTIKEHQREKPPPQFQTRSAEARDGIVKPRVQKASIPISQLKPLPSKSLDRSLPSGLRNPGERQSYVQRRTGVLTDDEYGQIGRSMSMDRQDIVRRTQNSRLAVPQTKVARSSVISQKSICTPKTSKEELVNLTGPNYTSTPKDQAHKETRECKGDRVNGERSVTTAIPKGYTVVRANMSPVEWAWLCDMKQKPERNVYAHQIARPQSSVDSRMSAGENIYEKVPARQLQQQSQMADMNFVRSSPQRNTIATMNRNRNVQIIDGATLQYLDQQRQQQRSSTAMAVEASVQVTSSPQPPRCQSVLDEMLVPHHLAYDSMNGTPVVMRHKQIPTLSREEILSRVKEFCRKSMNKTPTKMGSTQTLNKEMNGKVPSDISPVSYASVEYRQKTLPKVLAPQVPQRIQSLQSPLASPPIYAQVNKQIATSHSIGSDRYSSPVRSSSESGRVRLPTGSDSDSVFLPGNQQPSSPGRYIIMESENVTPAQVMRFRDTRSTGDVYGQVHPGQQYGYIQVKPQPQSRISMDGRSTPLILDVSRSPVYLNVAGQQRQQQQLQQQQIQPQRNTGSIVYLQAKDQVYRPIKPTRIIPMNRGAPRSVGFPYESESGSEAGEIQLILQNRRIEEDWQNDKSGRNQSAEQVPDDRRRQARREDPRRHTLGGDMLQYGPHGGQPGPQQRAMDLETPPIRGYTPINQGPLFDEDPGIMSEVETASTGFRRGGKQRSSLPVVRTPSKTLERPLGLVFLQYRSETKRALLPNEITSIDTVRALFVRSFPRQLTMAYLEGPNVKIYIHDASKDMFYELEDVRSHLREIRDRSVLRLFESNEVAAPQVLPGGPGVPQPLPQQPGGHWDQDQSYFSEPEFDSEYQHQHIHKSKSGKPAPYYVGGTQTLPRGMYSDRNKPTVVGAPAKPLRSYGSRGSMGPPFPYPPDQLYSIPDGYTSSPERVTRGGYEEPYYSQYGTRGSTVTPIIDEEQRCDGSLSDDQYALYGMKVSGRIPRNPNQPYDLTRPEDLHRIRVEHMERQLANLTGLVQKALNQNPPLPHSAINSNYLGVPGQCRGGLDDLDGHSSSSSTSIQDKSVSFEKSVSFSDDIQGVPKSHSPQHAADTKPPKPAIKSSTLPRTSSQERDRLKPPPPPKPLALASTHPNYRPNIALAPEVYNHLRVLQKEAQDLRMEVRTLRRLSQAQAVAVREKIKDTFMSIRATLLASSGSNWGQGDQEKTRISREEELYKQEIIRLEKDLSDLESSVEGLRGEVINRRTRVNMAAVEDMALVLSRASKTVAELKMRFPGLQQGLRNILANEMEKIVREEKFLKDEPDRLESALRRCKKLTGTLVTLKRLASVQEQRLPVPEPTNEDPPRSAEISSANKPIPSPRMGTIAVGGGIPPENALDALLDELQTFAKPQTQPGDARPDDSTSDDSSQTLHNTITTQLSQSSLFPNNDPNAPQQPNNPGGPNMNQLPNNGLVTTVGGNPNSNMGSLRRLHSYPSGSDTDTSPPQPPRPVGKPPVPERNAELLSKVGNKRIPPPPPPRTSSRSPLASPTSPNIPQRLPSVCESDQMGNGSGSGQDGSGNSSGNESGNDHTQRQLALEMRHQELLKKQKMLQEQYARLQQMSKNSIAMPPADILQLKKTGSESNLPQKMGLNMTVTGSMKNLNADATVQEKNEKNLQSSAAAAAADDQKQLNAQNNSGPGGSLAGSTSTTSSSSSSTTGTTTNKVYETDIL